MVSDWQDFKANVYRRIKGMERLLTEKGERIDQLEIKLASQMTEIKGFKQGMKSLEQAIIEKDKVMDKLLTKFGAVPSSLQQTVAFHVFLASDKWVVNDDVVVFDEVALDHGYGYKPRLGIYVVPKAGTYVISWTMYCYGQELFRTLLVLNGSVKGSAWTDSELSKDIHQTSGLVVLALNQGVHLFIRMGPIFGNGTILSRNDTAISTFSGWNLD
ncbi:uncharacterized protein LOC117339971 [Pecten maximus]|uniref:uncharacterized protein LOC117339971 n=1 Tax=Pecten maximus TaxID=6579 RepID=UPI001458B190|nr:uncharacterized protein LOC117339971 [Pecten maximus]